MQNNWHNHFGECLVISHGLDIEIDMRIPLSSTEPDIKDIYRNVK